jgi:hypothetical protein
MAIASGRRTVMPAALAFAAVVSISFARADSQPQPRAVIRGTGSDIRIVYETPRPPATEVRASLSEDPVAEALRRKAGGENDGAIIAFLRMHQASFPEVIDSDVVREFRIAGAGEDVIAVLLTYTAVDIGETAGGAPVQSLPEPQSAYAGAYPDLVGMGYPFYGGGYFGGGFFDGGHGGRKHVGKKHFDGRAHGRPSFRFDRPSFPKRNVSRTRSHSMARQSR